MKVKLVTGTRLKFGAADCVLTHDTELEFPKVDSNQQMAETLFGANLAKVDDNLANLSHSTTEIETKTNDFDIEGKAVFEAVTYDVTFGANGVADKVETSRVPYVEETKKKHK